MAALCGETSLLFLQCILPCDVSPEVLYHFVSANKGIFVPVTNCDAAANANVCVGDRDLAYEPPSKRCRTQHSYDVTIRAEIGKYTYNDG